MNQKNPFFLTRVDGPQHGGARITAAAPLPRVMQIDEAITLAATLLNVAGVELPVFIDLFSRLFHHKPAAAPPAAPPVAPAVPAAPVAAPVAPVAPVAAPAPAPKK